MFENFIYNDGGRKLSGARLEKSMAWSDLKHARIFNSGSARDCVARSLSIITGVENYETIWRKLADINRAQGKHRSADKGVRTQTDAVRNYIRSLGLELVTLEKPIALKDFPVPAGRVAVWLNGHLTAFVDGVMHDTHNCSPAGRATVYGYWYIKETARLFNVVSTVTKTKLNAAPLNAQQAATMSKLLLDNYKRETIITPI